MADDGSASMRGHVLGFPGKVRIRVGRDIWQKRAFACGACLGRRVSGDSSSELWAVAQRDIGVTRKGQGALRICIRAVLGRGDALGRRAAISPSTPSLLGGSRTARGRRRKILAYRTRSPPPTNFLASRDSSSRTTSRHHHLWYLLARPPALGTQLGLWLRCGAQSAVCLRA